MSGALDGAPGETKLPPFVAVIGLHRSGSSCLAGVLHHLGVHLGKHLGGFEPTGGFETKELIQLCEAAYPFPSTELELSPEGLRRRLAVHVRLRREEARDRKTIAGGKYPHLCAMGEELMDVCDDLRVIHIDRDLGESIRSLQTRSAQAKGWLHVTAEEAEAVQRWLWSRKTEFLKRVDHVTVRYDDLLSDPRREIARLVEYLGIRPSPAQVGAAAAHVKAELKTHSAAPTAPADRSRPGGALRESAGALNGETPVVIGGLGGSGTRVFARILKRAGIFMGLSVSAQEDADFLKGFHTAWVHRWLEHVIRGRALNIDQMSKGFRRRIRAHLGEQDLGEWGWKYPPSMHLLAFIRGIYPGFRFIHVIRDGRDMVFSGNQRQLGRVGDLLVPGDLAEPSLRSAVFWAKANGRVADWAEREMADRYLRVRFEDVCLNPGPTIGTIFSFLGKGSADMSEAVSEVKAPESIGRWLRQDAGVRGRVAEILKEPLSRFGYPDAC